MCVCAFFDFVVFLFIDFLPNKKIHITFNISIYINIYYRFIPCSPGDLIILMSDGVHDNIDPEHLGLTPAEAGGGTQEKEWDKVGWESGIKSYR